MGHHEEYPAAPEVSWSMTQVIPLASILLTWFDSHGRRTLPTYLENDPYAIWVGEVLLQQTQMA